MKRRNLIRWLALLLLVLIPVSASAAQLGSLLVQEIDHPVCLYHVADLQGNFTSDFSGYIQSEDVTDAAETAKIVQRYVLDHNVTGQKLTPENGEALFENLQTGTYLVCSLRTPGEFAPFLLPIPTLLDGEIIYDIQAKPKIEDIPRERDPGSGDSRPNDKEIPQTGTSVIPQYVLMVLGTLMTLAGLYEVLAGREEHPHD